VSELDILYRMAVALAVGAVIGLERGWAERNAPEGTRVAGLRTFTLIGLSGGLVARYVARATPATVAPMMMGFSVCSGMAFLFAGAGGPDTMTAVQSILAPQAVLDGVFGVAAYWVLAERFRKDDSLV